MYITAIYFLFLEKKKNSSKKSLFPEEVYTGALQF